MVSISSSYLSFSRGYSIPSNLFFLPMNTMHKYEMYCIHDRPLVWRSFRWWCRKVVEMVQTESSKLSELEEQLCLMGKYVDFAWLHFCIVTHVFKPLCMAASEGHATVSEESFRLLFHYIFPVTSHDLRSRVRYRSPERKGSISWYKVILVMNRFADKSIS